MPAALLLLVCNRLVTSDLLNSQSRVDLIATVAPAVTTPMIGLSNAIGNAPSGNVCLPNRALITRSSGPKDNPVRFFFYS